MPKRDSLKQKKSRTRKRIRTRSKPRERVRARSKSRKRVRSRSKSRKRTRRRNIKQSGGNCRDCIMITLMVFIALIYISGIFDYGNTIDDYIKITENNLDVAQDLGISLVEYDTNVDRILNDMLQNVDSKSLDKGMSYNLKLNDNLQIHDINPYLKDEQMRTERRLNQFGNNDVTTRDLTGFYDSRKYVKQYNKDWRVKQKKDTSYIHEADINTMLTTFMPKILSMANKGIPDNIEFSGSSLSVSRSPFGPQNFHQDIDQLTLFSSATADNEYRIMIFDRDETYDTSWTQIATEIDTRKAEKYVKTSFGKYDFAKLIDFDIDKSKFIALIFDNNKVFHRTPPTKFWNWITNNMPSKRRITQFRISWDDYDQVEEFDPERFQEIMGGGGYSIS